jgi:formylglycine-generating enzyme required for sulfatase activity
MLFVSVSLFAGLRANNLQLGTPVISDPQHISFTIQWNNSWKISSGPSNWDAVWIFIKYTTCPTITAPWSHVGLSTTSSDHTVTGGILQVDATTDGLGVFIHRIANGSGNIASATVTLKMTITDASYNYQVNGTEMVYVPQGAFYVGDGNGGGGNKYGFCMDASYDPVNITAAVQASGFTAASQYIFQNNGWGSPVAIPSTFPLGYNGFYCQKYEISQEEYVAFLNTLTYDQQATLFNPLCPPNSAVGTFVLASTPNPQNCRNGIRIQTPGTVDNIPAVVGCDLNLNDVFNEAADGMYIPCNWLNWALLIAYLDWAALRPMTEFEFEKICRGTISPVVNEYVWGNNTILATNAGSISNPGQANETSLTSGNGLCVYGSGSLNQGPLRCGIEATSVTNRSQAGSSYYGAMDMGGNLFEQCIGGMTYNFSTFTTANGDGYLTAAGAANTPNWPPNGGGAGGGITRGSEWFDNSPQWGQTSNRDLLNNNFNQTRDYRVGGRGVRTY